MECNLHDNASVRQQYYFHANRFILYTVPCTLLQTVANSQFMNFTPSINDYKVGENTFTSFSVQQEGYKLLEYCLTILECCLQWKMCNGSISCTLKSAYTSVAQASQMFKGQGSSNAISGLKWEISYFSALFVVTFKHMHYLVLDYYTHMYTHANTFCNNIPILALERFNTFTSAECTQTLTVVC